MSAFKGLFWKELKISKYDFYTVLGLMLLIYIGAFSLSQYFAEPIIMAFIFFFIYVMHIGYLPLFVLSSLRREGKTQLWLHNPNRGAILLSAKIAAGLTYYFVSLFIAFLAAYVSFEQVVIAAIPADFEVHGLKALLLVALFITGMTIYYSIWLQFYWTIYHALKSIPTIKNIRWLIIVVLWGAISSASTYLLTTPLFEKINNTGVIQIQVLKEVSFQVKQAANGVIPNMGTINISIATMLLYCILGVMVFSISVWLLERKVEV